MIISASRRTDLPSFYSEWFLRRLREGLVLTRNPVNPSRVTGIALSPEVVDCIVFWTKDPANMMDKLDEIDSMGYRYLFQFTLTPYGRELERNLRPKPDIIDTFIRLSDRLGPQRVLWRYDPIVLNKELDISYHMEQFERLCRRMAAHTCQCTVSFVDSYDKLAGPFQRGLLREPTFQEQERLAKGLAKVASAYGLPLRACAEKHDFSSCGIVPAACIDPDILEAVCGYPLKTEPDTGQREYCGCCRSIDVGAYNTCRNGCVYCYANYNERTVQKNSALHKPSSYLMVGEMSAADHLSTPQVQSLRREFEQLHID